MKLLIIGDSHIPRRVKDIPQEFYDKILELTKKELFLYAFFTGDLIKAPKFMDFINLRTKRDVFVVIGNMDYFDGNRDAPIFEDLKITFSDGGKMVIGLTHGAQIEPRGDQGQLDYLARQKGFNILISGHTHKEDIYLSDKGVLLLNPGSSTGAWSFVASLIPAFMVLEINEDTRSINVILFRLDKRSKKIDESKSYYLFKNNQIEKKY